MAWNEPGNNGNNKDPWGNNRKRNDGDGPPDLDEVFKNLFRKFSGRGGSGGSGGKGPAYLVGLGLIIAAGFYAASGFGIVNEQERAVVLRFGEYHETVGPGLRWNPPLIDEVFTENVTRVRSWDTKEQMLTKDLNIVDIRLSVQYAIDDARNFILNVKNPQESLQQAANSALRHVVGSMAMHQVLTEGRSQLAIEVRDRLQDYLQDYGTGILIDKVNVEETNPPAQVQNAFDDVIRAREDEERYKNEAQAYVNSVIPAARGRSQRMVEEAMGYREQVIARSKGEADRFTMLLTEYNKAPEVTRERLYLETMEDVLGETSKVLVDVEGGNNMVYLPLDKLIEAGERTRKASALAPTASEVDLMAERVTEKLLQEANRASSNRIREGR